MKQKLKKILLLYLFTGTLFVSCTMEEDYIKEKDYREKLNLQLKRITLKEVESNSKAIEKFKTPKARFKITSNTNRVINDTINNFSIDSNLGIYIENGEYHSYTFKINRPNGSNFLLENLVVSKKPNNEYETIIYQYNINQLELELIQKREYVDLYGKINKIMLENSNIANDLLGKYYFNGSCWEDYNYYQPERICTEGGNHTYAQCHECDGCGTSSGPQPGGMVSGSTLVPCGDDGGAPYIPPQDIPNPNDSYYGNYTGSNTTTTTLTSPVDLCTTCPEFNEDNPCARLVKKTSSTAYKQKFKDLNVRANYTSTQESGFGEVITSGISQYIDGIPNGHSELIPPLGSINLTHIHNNIPLPDDVGTFYESRIKILAPGDISVLARKCQIANTDPTEAFVVMASDEGVFAISITEEFVLNGTTVSTDLWNNFRLNYDKRGIAINTDPYLNAQGRRAALQIMLLEELKIIGLENKIALFEGTIENENDSDINNYNIKWTQKKLGKNFLGVAILKPTPCN